VKLHYLILLMVMMNGSALPAIAQITRDNSLPNPSIVTSSNPTTQIITGGTTATNNLFHSFTQFSIPTNGTAQFQHVPTIQNLFIRVTGNQASSIDGKIETALTGNLTQRGNANLFLLNPNGILFGRNASLNIGGSFIASTADRIRLSNGSEFSARNPTAPLLTIATPIGLQFGNNPGAIDNQSIASQGNLIVGLRIPNRQTLGLFGGSLSLSGGLLTATNAQVELAAIGANGQVDFNLATKTFDYPVSEFRDITIQNGGFISLEGTSSTAKLTARNMTFQSSGNQNTGIGSTAIGGQIFLDATSNIIFNGQRSRIISNINTPGQGTAIGIAAQNLQLTQGGNITTFTQGQGQGGDLVITAANTINIEGNSLLSTNSQGSTTQSAQGNSGNLRIQTANLQLTNGGQINSIAERSSGKSGNITINATDTILLAGTARPASNLRAAPSQITTETRGTGNAGQLNITTNRLNVSSGAQIRTSTRTSGAAGELNIQANEIDVTGVAQAADGRFLLTANDRRLASTISADAQPNTSGNGANLNITTDRLTLSNGGIIQSVTFGSGDAGNVNLNAREFVRLQGRAANPNDPYPSSILAFSGGIPNEPILGFPNATGKGGNITIITPQLEVSNGAQIALGSLNTTPNAKGAGDLLQINADRLRLDQGKLNASTNSGNGGNIEVNASQLLLLRNNSKIITQAGSAAQGGNGGNIKITSPFVFAIAKENSDINANAFTGNGGNVNITAQSILGLTLRPQDTPLSDITASSQFGQQGVIVLNSPNIDPDRGTVVLPVAPNDPSNKIDQSCSANASVGGKFTLASDGGLPANPATPPVTANLVRLAQLPPVKSTAPRSTSATPETLTIIREAQSVQRLGDRKLRLTASSNAASPINGAHCR
jgi:filamentous hemagglutinin family protein